MPSILKVCLYDKECRWKKEHIIGRYSSPNKTPVTICTFDENCNQQRIVNIYQAKKLFMQNLQKNAKSSFKNAKKIV